MPNTVAITDTARELAQMIIDDKHEYSHCCNVAKFDRIFHCGFPVDIPFRDSRKTANRWLFMAESGARKYQDCFVSAEDEPVFSVIDILGTAVMLAEYYQQHIADLAPILYAPVQPLTMAPQRHGSRVS